MKTWGIKMYIPRSKKVYTWDRMIKLLLSKIIKDSKTGCWLWQGSCFESGYGQIGYHGKSLRTHRVSWIYHNGEIPKGFNVLHKCDIRNCINPNHLFLGKPIDNTTDMINKNRRVNPTAKLSEFDVIFIREDTRPQIKIAKEYGISKSQISKIKSGKAWR